MACADPHELTEVGTEIDVDGAVKPAGVRVRGRLDRLERDGEGRLVVVDVKTGKTPVSKDDAQRHAQLAMYQLAVAEGLLPQGDTPGGGRLVYLGKAAAGGATEREQDPQTAGHPRGMARAGAAGGGRHPGAGVRRADQRRLRALPGAGDVPGPGRRGGRHDAALQPRRTGFARSAFSRPPRSRPR